MFTKYGKMDCEKVHSMSKKKNPGFHSSAIDLVIELRQVTSNRPQVTYRPNGDTILDNNMDVSGSPCL